MINPIATRCQSFPGEGVGFNEVKNRKMSYIRGEMDRISRKTGKISLIIIVWLSFILGVILFPNSFLFGWGKLLNVGSMYLNYRLGFFYYGTNVIRRSRKWNEFNSSLVWTWTYIFLHWFWRKVLNLDVEDFEVDSPQLWTYQFIQSFSFFYW
jgi:hypothetical protein